MSDQGSHVKTMNQKFGLVDRILRARKTLAIPRLEQKVGVSCDDLRFPFCGHFFRQPFATLNNEIKTRKFSKKWRARQVSNLRPPA